MNIANLIKRYRVTLKDRTVNISKNALISRRCFFEGYNHIGSWTLFDGIIGRYSYIGENCRIYANIGKFCSISSHVSTVGGKHPSSQWVSTHPVFYSMSKQCGCTFVEEERFDEKSKKVEIGNDVWIGYGVIIMGGVHIGDGAIVAAGSLVTKSVSPYTIVGGVPAKEIHKRFNVKIIEFLTEFKWWEKTDKWLKENAVFFDSIEHLKNAMEDNQ